MSDRPQNVVVSDSFDDIRSPDIRFLQEAARCGPVTVLLWTDKAVQTRTGTLPKFSFAERLYFLNALRYVSRVEPLDSELTPSALTALPGGRPDIWIDRTRGRDPIREEFCRKMNLPYRVLSQKELSGFPLPPTKSASNRKKVVVTGCYDFFHTGHIRFFEEVSAFGDLYVIVGHDANIRLLKGDGHPLLPDRERRYLAGSIRHVTEALISSGNGWLDAEPEIQRLKPDIYAVNEDGDKGGKREYCVAHGIEYLVLKRTPAPGLPARSSTDLRGF